MAQHLVAWLGSFVIFQGIRTSSAKKPYIFAIFQGVQTPVPPLCIRPRIFQISLFGSLYYNIDDALNKVL